MIQTIIASTRRHAERLAQLRVWGPPLLLLRLPRRLPRRPALLVRVTM